MRFGVFLAPGRVPVTDAAAGPAGLRFVGDPRPAHKVILKLVRLPHPVSGAGHIP